MWCYFYGLLIFLVLMGGESSLLAQSKGSRRLMPDDTILEERFFAKDKKIERRYYDKKEKLIKIAIYNTDASGKSLKSSVYSGQGKLRYWERYVYSEDGNTLLEVRVFNPTGGLIMKTTFEGGKQKVVDANNRVMSEEEWKNLR